MTLKVANLGEGGQGLSDGHKGAGVTVKELFGAVRDELDGVKTAAVLAEADAVVTAEADAVVTAEADASDLATAITLVNDIKAKYNAAVALNNDLKAKYNASVALTNELKTQLGAVGSDTKTFEK